VYRVKKFQQYGCKFSGGPGPIDLLQGLVRGAVIDLHVTITFLPVLVNDFSRNQVQGHFLLAASLGKRDMNSWQTKLGSFCENWNATSLALSIKDSARVSERVGTESAGRDAAGGRSGQGAELAVCLVSKWEERRSKEAYSVLAIGLRAAWPKASAKATTAPAKPSQRPVG